MNTSASASPRRREIDDLDLAIADLSARINACTSELLVLLREFDERAGFRQWNFPSCAEWLHWRCDLSLSAAREKVRAARALKCLPQISEAFARGGSPIPRCARSRGWRRRRTRRRCSPSRCRRRRRWWRSAAGRCATSTRRARRRWNGLHRERALRVFRDVNRGMLTFTVELPLEQGELLCRALDKAAADPTTVSCTRAGTKS